jgi:5-bromo-4-chloroindolyl phosphate hydrolysis protein
MRAELDARRAPRRFRLRPESTAVLPPRKAWALRIAPWFLALPFVTSLIGGSVVDVLGLAGALACCHGGMRLVERGRQAEADYLRRTIARAPRLPRKLLGAGLTALGVLLASLLASSAGIAASLLFAGAAFGGCVLAYGLDPRQDKGLAPDTAAGAEVRMETVVAAIAEAERKIEEIEHWAKRLRSRELTRHLQRIVAQARAILDEIEKDPADIRRARRFLVTYLDGTRDVVEKYAAQQEDLAETPLADNFRRVLTTVESVFAEQHAVLKRNETLDLEVRIEVLETQLLREGVAR